MATSNAATTFLEYRLLSYVFKNNAASFDSPGDNLWVGLATAVSDAETGSPSDLTEASYSGYGREQVAHANWTISSSSTDAATVRNTNNIEWSASTTDGTSTITHVFIASAETSGNIYFVGALEATKAIAEGDIFRINATNLVFEMK